MWNMFVFFVVTLSVLCYVFIKPFFVIYFSFFLLKQYLTFWFPIHRVT